MGQIKGTAIVYAGYEYQTLFGVRKLLEWYKNPGLYQQVAFEADTSDENIPAAVDDIVCKRVDDTYEYYQVKFTADEQRHELSWDWLFHKTKKGRSLVRKLFNGLHQLDLNKLYSAQLVTNRIPSEEVSLSLTNDYLDYTKLSDEVKQKFIDELETEADVKFLFSHLKFSHSRKDILNLRLELLSEAFKIGATEFIRHLADEARVWATHQNYPNEGGWIHLSDVKNILSIARPKPLPQSFSVPNDYHPPCKKFHKDLLGNIVERKDSIFVVTGPPGRGKSTYLSYLTTKLSESKIPYIRHHYFLSVEDKTGDRYSHFSVENDLKQQLEIFHGVRAKSLSKAMQICSENYDSKDKPLVVLIDGLDHVWRDNKEDINPLDSLFNGLFPPINNVIYVIGTQPVEDKKLPNKLIKIKRRSDWLTLPPLTGNSILELLKVQAEQGRLQLKCHSEQKSEFLKESAGALLELTSGHPLSIIYVIEQLTASKTPINAYEIEKFPKIFGEHVYDYYSELWRVISYPQKYALHIISEFNFGWEKTHLNDLVLNGEPNDYVSGIQHLLYRSRTGYKSFHESLIAFVKGLPEHSQIIQKYLPAVVHWVATQAPDYIRNTWMFRCNLYAGNYENIKNELTREWVVERLSEGYFSNELEGILETTSLHFIKNGFLPESHHCRTIKTRISNASHNIHELNRLVELTLKRAPSSVIDEYLATAEQLAPDELAQLSICLLYRGNKTDSEALNKLAIDAYNASYLLRTRQNDGTHEVSEIFRSEILLEHDISENVEKFGESYYPDVIQACVESSDIEALIKYHNIFDDVASQIKAELSCFRLAITEGIEPNIFLDNRCLNKSTFLNCARRLQTDLCEDEVTINFPEGKATIQSQSSSYLEEFFHSLFMILELEGDCSWLQCSLNLDPYHSHKKSDLTKVSDAITKAAMHISQLIHDNYQVSFSEVLASVYQCDLEYSDHWEQQAVNNFLHQLIIAALDCHLLFTGTPLNKNEIRYLVESDLYNKVRFFHWYAEQKLKLLTSEAVEVLMDSILGDLSDFDIQERAHLLIAAGEIALTHENEKDADAYIKQAWDLTIGYGSYKDYTISQVISSVEYLTEVDSEGAIEILKDLAPFISSFDELTTEGSAPNDEVNKLLAKFSLSTLASKYENELINGEASAADNTLSNFLKFGDLSSPLSEKLCKTGLLSENLRALESRANEGDARAQQLLAVALEHNGSKNVKQKENGYANSKIEKEPLGTEDFKKFPPNMFLDFVEAYKERYLYEEHYVAWFNFWVSQGKHKEILDNLTPLAKGRTKYELRYILDALFELSLKHRGKRKSFDLLIAAHNEKRGWDTYYETRSSFSRLNKVAEVYPERADEFIEKTTFNIEGEGLTLPYHRYTYLLCQLNRREEANEFTRSLAKQLIDETSILGAESPNWRWDNRGIDDVLLDIIISRLDTSIASIKWWVAQQLVKLLIDPIFLKSIENKLLKRLNRATIELQCIEILSIFYFANKLGYKPHKDIAKSVKARSICSDLIVDSLGLNHAMCSMAFDASVFIPFQKKALRKAFDSANGRDFPPVYLRSLEELQNAARMPFPIPLTEFMRSEWCKMQSEAQNYDSYLSYYVNSDGHSRDNTALIYPFSGLRARSAYLRALEFTAVNFGMPRYIHLLKAQIAYPFDTCLFSLEPESIIEVNNYEWSIERSKVLESIQAVILDLESSSQGNELGAISFSAPIDDLSFLEIEIIRAIEEPESIPAEQEDPWLSRCQIHALDTEKTIETVSVKGNRLQSLAAKSYPHLHYGHWHSEIDSRGVYCPISFDEDTKITMSYVENCLQFLCSDNKIAYFKYANNNWQPSYNRFGGANTITALMLEKENRKAWCIPTGNEVYRCRVKVFKREKSYSKFEKEEYEILLDILCS